MAGHAQALAGEAKLLLGGGLDIDAVYFHAQIGGDVLHHLGDVGLQLGPLGDHGHIHIAQMMENIAADLGVDAGRVNVKATTEEKLGFTGEGLGMSCHAVCILEEK